MNATGFYSGWRCLHSQIRQYNYQHAKKDKIIDDTILYSNSIEQASMTPGTF